LEWFDDLRSLSALILAAAEPDDLSELHPAAVRAFDQYAQSRRERDRQRWELQRARKARGGLPRLRPYTAAPQSAALMAAVGSTAVPMLEAALTERRDQLRWLIERLRVRDRRTTPLTKRHPLSPGLRADIIPLVAVSIPRELEALRGQAKHTYSFTAAHIPQLIWDELFEQEFAQLLSETKRDFARRFCSMSLIRFRLGATWSECGRLLDLPERRAVSLARECTLRLQRARHQQAFAAALQAAADWVDAQPLTDFAQRRSELEALTRIPIGDWKTICAAAQTPAGRPEGRRYATAWLWCDLTGGDYRLAPALHTHGASSHQKPITRYTRWLKQRDRVDRLTPHLRAYGIELLRSNTG
jgi:hypothetical protein